MPESVLTEPISVEKELSKAAPGTPARRSSRTFNSFQIAQAQFGGNTGSNPVGDAITCEDASGMAFQKIHGLSGREPFNCGSLSLQEAAIAYCSELSSSLSPSDFESELSPSLSPSEIERVKSRRFIIDLNVVTCSCNYAICCSNLVFSHTRVCKSVTFMRMLACVSPQSKSHQDLFLLT